MNQRKTCMHPAERFEHFWHLQFTCLRGDLGCQKKKKIALFTHLWALFPLKCVLLSVALPPMPSGQAISRNTPDSQKRQEAWIPSAQQPSKPNSQVSSQK